MFGVKELSKNVIGSGWLLILPTLAVEISEPAINTHALSTGPGSTERILISAPFSDGGCHFPTATVRGNHLLNYADQRSNKHGRAFCANRYTVLNLS
jgi:hypothetical protein